MIYQVLLLTGITNTNLKFVEACLRCLRTIFLMNDPPVHLIYEVRLLHRYLQSFWRQICIGITFGSCSQSVPPDFLFSMYQIKEKFNPIMLCAYTKSSYLQLSNKLLLLFSLTDLIQILSYDV